MTSVQTNHLKMEEMMRDLGISTDVQRFVLDLSHSKIPWENLSEQVCQLSQTITDKSQPDEKELNMSLSTVFDEFLMLPVDVCIPPTFAEPTEKSVTDVLMHLKHFHRFLGAIGQLDCPTAYKIKAIQCQSHLHTISANLPLAVCSAITMGLHKSIFDSTLHLVNTVPLSDSELEELRAAVSFASPSFERSLIGEIGYTYFSRFCRTDSELINEWKSLIKESPSLKPFYRRVLIRRALPFIDPTVRNIYFEQICHCLSVYRSDRSRFQSHEILGKASLKKAYIDYFLGPTFHILEQSLLFESSLNRINTWLSITLEMIGDDNQPSTNLRGEWGSIEVRRTASEVHSHLFLTSHNCKPLEYVIHTPKPLN